MTTAVLMLAAVASVAGTSHATPGVMSTSQVDAAITKTRTTQATYALVSTNEIRLDDKTIHEFAAEYNRGDLHRVETPRDRIVANCRTGWSAHLNVATGEVSRREGTSGVACGIATNVFRSAEVLGSRQSQFGRVQQVKIVTNHDLRTYDVAENGAIVGQTIAEPDGKLRLIMRAISVTEQLPIGDIFSEASLAKSVVSDELKEKASDPANWQAP